VQTKPLDSLMVDMLHVETQLHHQGFQRVAGIDEAGRGPLAGPVVAAAVILPRDVHPGGIKDSKQLTSAQREACFEKILSCALSVGVGYVPAPEIDRINILQASFQAMLKAVENLKTTADFLLIDGPYTLPLPTAQQGIPQGDRRCLSIAAASIIAKVFRDRLMLDYHQLYPMYGFDRHKGYGTPQHMEALRRHGPCPLHRLSFRGIGL
jgi:ribonuclease HII